MDLNKTFSDQNFDLGLRSENIEFWKLPVAQNSSKMGTEKSSW